MSAPLSILASGMVTGVGLSARASCAAIRCGINNFNDTRFMGRSGKWIVGSEVPLRPPQRGLTKLAKMAALAIQQCLDAVPNSSSTPIILCIAEEDRLGRLPGLGGPLLFEIERELGVKFHPDSSVLAQGRVGGAVAILRAQKLFHERRHSHVIVAGVDSYLFGPTLAALEQHDRLLTPANSNGFVPGEAAAAVLLASDAPDGGVVLTCHGPGFARESATIHSEKPLRGEGMVEAMRAALATAGMGLEDVDCRISDLSGEQYRFKEVALATTRIRRDHREEFGLWHPADCVGEVGAAAPLVMLGVVYFAGRKRYLPGNTFLAHFSGDDDKRAALVLSARRSG
jgi:3-oxoacyl-[acyl-carrier-protein] synthase-1